MYVFWNRFSTKIYPGDLGDSRAALFWMEHWFQFIQGKAGFGSLPIFFPITNTLSGSDAFLIQGFFHSILRFLGLDLGTSFVISTILVHVIGSYSCVAILRRFKINLRYKLLIILLYGSMTPFWLSRNHVQLLVFPMLGWVVYFLYKFYLSKKFLYLSISLIIFFSILLSAGYAIAFSLFYIVVFFMCLVVFVAPKTIISNLLTLITAKQMMGLLVISAPLIYIFSKLYLSSDTLISSHSKGETLFYSPSASDLVSIPTSLKGIEGSVAPLSRLLAHFDSLPNPTGEFGGSFGFTTLFAIVIVIFFAMRCFMIKGWVASSTSLKIVFLASSALIICYLLILKDGRGINIWASTFYHFPFFSSIRVVSRFTLLASLIIPFLLGFGLWEIRGNLMRYKLFDRSVLALTFLLFLNQPVNFYGSFHVSDILVLNQIEAKVKDSCSSFYLLNSTSQRPELPFWVISGDALALATRTSIPAINGASSFFPKNYPAELYAQSDREATLSKLNDWIALNNLKGVCLIEYIRTGESLSKTTVTAFKIIEG